MKKLFVLFLVAAAAISAKAPVEGYKVGDTVTDFKLKNIDGNNLSMADYPSAKGFIVVFTCNHCPVAKKYESRIMALDKQYASKGYPVLAISPNDPVQQPGDSYENMQKLAAEKKYSFPYMFDDTQETSLAFGVKATPHAFVIRKTTAGNIVEYIGAIDNDTEGNNPEKIKYVEQAVNALLDGKKPEVASTKAFGCSISWKKGKV
jgi:glutathione peroxidase-family protein